MKVLRRRLCKIKVDAYFFLVIFFLLSFLTFKFLFYFFYLFSAAATYLILFVFTFFVFKTTSFWMTSKILFSLKKVLLLLFNFYLILRFFKDRFWLVYYFFSFFLKQCLTYNINLLLIQYFFVFLDFPIFRTKRIPILIKLLCFVFRNKTI